MLFPLIVCRHSWSKQTLGQWLDYLACRRSSALQLYQAAYPALQGRCQEQTPKTDPQDRPQEQTPKTDPNNIAKHRPYQQTPDTSPKNKPQKQSPSISPKNRPKTRPQPSSKCAASAVKASNADKLGCTDSSSSSDIAIRAWHVEEHQKHDVGTDLGMVWAQSLFSY